MKTAKSVNTAPPAYSSERLPLCSSARLKRSIVPATAPRVWSKSSPCAPAARQCTHARSATAPHACHLVQQAQVALHLALYVHRHLLEVLCALADAVNLRVVLPLQPLRVVLLQLLRLSAAEQRTAPAVAAHAVARGCVNPTSAHLATAVTWQRATGAHRLPRFMPPGWRRAASVAAGAGRGAREATRSRQLRTRRARSRDGAASGAARRACAAASATRDGALRLADDSEGHDRDPLEKSSLFRLPAANRARRRAMVLLMESLMESRGASGARRVSPLVLARRILPWERPGKPRTPTIAEDVASEAEAQDDENAVPQCVAEAWQSPCTPPCAAACSPTPSEQQASCCASPASAPRQPLSPLGNGMDTLALVGATPRPFAAAGDDRFSFGVAVDVDLASPLPSFAVRDANEIALSPFASPFAASDVGTPACSHAALCVS